MTHTGIPVQDLTDADLSRDLEDVYARRNDMLLHGAADQFRNNVRRMAELEAEYLYRFADQVVEAGGKQHI